MLQAHLIQPSNSLWSAPVILVRKKDGLTHFCVDYRRLSSITRKDSYPIPRVDDALDAFSSANSGGSSVSQNKLPQLILGCIYILK